MGFFKNLFPPKLSPEQLLVESIESLQISLSFALMTQYESRFAADSPLLANCVLTYAMYIDPMGEEARQYFRKQQQLVLSEASKISSNPLFSEAFSYLYAALVLNIVFKTRSPFSEPAAILSNRAAELDFTIPTTYDICGTGDALDCINAINAYSKAFKNKVMA